MDEITVKLEHLKNILEVNEARILNNKNRIEEIQKEIWTREVEEDIFAHIGLNVEQTEAQNSIEVLRERLFQLRGENLSKEKAIISSAKQYIKNLEKELEENR